MAFDMEELPNVVASMKRILEQLPAAFVMIGVMIRFSKASEGLMAINKGDSVHIEWTTSMRYDPFRNARDSVGSYQAILQTMVHNHNGKPHWAKNGQYYFTRRMLLRREKDLSRFQDMIRRFDPNGIFLNKFGRRILLESDEFSMDPSVSRCALQDYCVCAQGSDCGRLQVCSKYDGVYPICKNLVPVGGIPTGRK